MNTRARRVPPYNNPRFRLEDVPSLFLATNDDDVQHAIVDDQADVFQVFQGYNALQWHCDAVSTSPSLIWALIEYGIDVNALDQHKLPPNADPRHPPIIHRTALGYACRNGNVKAVRTLLQLGANPQGSPEVPLETPSGSIPRPKYPSPLQDLLNHQLDGPTGSCPFLIHLKDSHDTADDSDDDVPLLYQRQLRGLKRMHGPSTGSVQDNVQPACAYCSYGFNVHEAARVRGTDELKAITSHAQKLYAGQLLLAGMRILKCAMLLLQYLGSNLAAEQLAKGHDATLPSPIDCLLRSVWHFLGPSMLCWRDRFAERFHGLDPATLTRRELVQFAAQDPSVLVPDLQPWANLVIHASLASRRGSGDDDYEIVGHKGVQRIFALLERHPMLNRFPEGQFSDVTFSILAVGLRRKSSPPPRPRPIVITIKKQEVKKLEVKRAEEVKQDDDDDSGDSDGSGITVVFDDNGEPVQLPRQLAKEYRRA
ncbi:hypothetical protein PG988_009694 [Apiospora saccharicola]